MTAALPRPIWKEIRALLPMWTACMLALWSAGWVGGGLTIRVGVLAYALGSLALGASSIGHEYTHRTLPQLLAQPAARRRMFAAKLGALVPLLLVLTGSAWIVLFEAQHLRWPWQQHVMVILPLLGGLFVAPWLTMVCRNALAGAVFTCGIAGTSFVLTGLIGGWLGAGRLEPASPLLTAWLAAMVAFSLVTAVLSWRTFLRLEAIEGAGGALPLPRWVGGAAPVRTRHPLRALLRKELHLQYTTIVIGVSYIFVWAAVMFLGSVNPVFREFPLAPITFVYFVLLSILIGGLSSAEERQLGTLEWQVLLPVAAWKQWVVKVGVAIGLAVLLGVAVPAVLSTMQSSEQGGALTAAGLRAAALGVVLLTAYSVYMSSICTSGVRAVVFALPIVPMVLVLTQVASSASWWLQSIQGAPRSSRIPVAIHFLPPALALGFSVLLLRFAFVNHRFADRSAARVLAHAAGVLGFVAGGAVLVILGFAALAH